MKFFLGFLLFITGCALYQPAALIRQDFKPKKGGVVRAPIYGMKGRARAEATAIMVRFCSPDEPEIITISRGDTVTGSTSAALPLGITSTQNDSRTDDYISFTCETRPLAESTDQPSR